ncbi:MAG: hypothetical protein QOE92_1878 [Chloroflexota bacterium]|jgi:hypothetical protein|nr:hypothetical protein [Chloroflexota bacterium]
MMRALRLGGVGLVLAGAVGSLAPGLAVQAAGITWSEPVVVDANLAGGEPLVAETSHGNLVYTSHEGTTHLERAGFAGLMSTFEFSTTYRNQVNNWTSDDGGRTWQPVSLFGTGITQPPNQNTGFSDPDLTEDEGGRIYNTGINLANDALFSSGDGGKTWDRGTFQCASGDRPWLAAGKADNVWMASNLNTTGHNVLHSGDGGSSCDGPVPLSGGLLGGGIVASGTFNNHSWTGNGKLYYDHVDGSLVEPAQFNLGDGMTGLGVDYLPDAAGAYPADGSIEFTPLMVTSTTIFSHWPAMTIDSAENIYLVWDTDERSPEAPGGCAGDGPLANTVQMLVGTHTGPQQWSWSQVAVATPPDARVLWPWVAVGSPGNVSVVWYQYDKVVDPDCATEGKVYIYEAHIFDALSSNPTIVTTNAAGRNIAQNGICQGGTGCVASGKDRRLGDFFTNYVDANGCVLIASGDTTVPDAITGTDQVVSHPIFMRQTEGPGLRGAGGCSVPAGFTPTPPPTTAGVGTPNTSPDARLPLLLVIAGLVALVLGWLPRRSAPRA